MKLKHRVYDDRANETLFESEDNKACVDFVDENYDEEHIDFPHIWIETFEIN